MVSERALFCCICPVAFLPAPLCTDLVGVGCHWQEKQVARGTLRIPRTVWQSALLESKTRDSRGEGMNLQELPTNLPLDPTPPLFETLTIAWEQ